MGKIWILCGPLASGKSTVASLFAEAGAVILDADRIANELMDTDLKLRRQLSEAFGEEIFDELGELRRREIARRVFDDTEARRKLEAMVHPRVLDRLAEEAAVFRESGEGLMLMEVVLWLRLDPPPFPVDGICMTLAPEALLIERAVERGGMAEKEAEDRLEAQSDWRLWAKRADVLIDTDRPKEALRELVLSYYRAWTEPEEGREA